MKTLIPCSFFILLFSGIICSCTATKTSSSTEQYIYKADDQQLADTIARLDSVFFSYYNTCATNLDAYASFFSDSIEFYHDKGGLMTVKSEIVQSTKKYVCGRVTRELVKGTVEVYPIPGYGAIELGLHQFHNSEDPNAVAHPGRFTIIWQHTPVGWKIRRVISLH